MYFLIIYDNTYCMFIKRLFDIVFSLFLIPIVILPSLVIILMITIETKTMPIFLSKRVGKNNTLFLMPKFRTMSPNTPQVATHLLEDSHLYITRLGAFLRKTSLDEIPQIYSVLIGHMSFVGPRPALYNQFDLIKLREKNDIHLLKPGITGWAQINGRDDLSINKKVEIEIYYKKNISLLLDIKILFLTILKVFRMHDIKH